MGTIAHAVGELFGVADHQLDVLGMDVELRHSSAFRIDDLDDVAARSVEGRSSATTAKLPLALLRAFDGASQFVDVVTHFARLSWPRRSLVLVDALPEVVRMAVSLEPFVPDALWLREYPVRLGGAKFNARMTVIKLQRGDVLVHSPCAFDDLLTAEVSALGRVAAIIAPGNFHWLHVPSCQKAFPNAATYICPGVEKRAKDLPFDFVLSDEAPPLWGDELSQVALNGTRVMREVAFLHRASRTLILVDLIENFTAATPGTNKFLRILFRMIGMWNRPGPAPEYGLAWGNKTLVREGLRRVLDWEFDRVILSHGDIITHDAKQMVVDAWRKILA